MSTSCRSRFVTGKNIRTFEDLRGKTVGVSSIEAGSSSLVMKLLSARGLEYPRDYKMRAVGPILARWELLQSGEIDAGLQGAPLNYIAIDQGFPSLCEPRQEVPDFQFTSLNVDRRWAEREPGHHAKVHARLRARPSLVLRQSRRRRRRSRWRRPASAENTPSAPGTNTPTMRSSRGMATPATPPCRR